MCAKTKNKLLLAVLVRFTIKLLSEVEYIKYKI